MKIKQSNIANLPTKYGKFKIKAYKDLDSHQEHLAIITPDFEDIDAPYVRVHSECLTGDTLGSLKCDCQNQLQLAMTFIAKEGGLIIYHRQEGRNIGLLNKVNAYALQDQGKNTIDANLELGFKEDERDYSVIEYIFKDLNVNKIKLITNNPDKINFIKSIGVEILERIPSITKTNKYNEFYLNTKKSKMGHLL
ncbi:GTP cyclohydrolase II [Arcobacter sp. CECT 8985]|uniref:GTP cyclohydrolase II n=1 Tax=Arcobacter sp. CECT 8985 TaxID=1935424 RepID=UPI00100B6F47|nr:GTP cyclohydrolase II [Arcobacter sp. CECT 8985]RXJ87575.1 GTP cyclohydrolase II [Arcobacter sp. CECT 8985]